jgi:uncharacterized protein (TIGR02271 family)
MEGAPPRDPAARVEIRLDDGHRVTVPANLLVPSRNGDGAYEVPLGPEDLRSNANREQVVVPVVQEEVRVGKRAEERGSVVVHVVPRVQTEVVDVPLAEEDVVVERVPVNRFVSGVQPVRQDGDVTVVPVYEEVLVVERRLMLKEEVRVRRNRRVRHERQQVDLRTEDVQVMRSGDGQTS